MIKKDLKIIVSFYFYRETAKHIIKNLDFDSFGDTPEEMVEAVYKVLPNEDAIDEFEDFSRDILNYNNNKKLMGF